MRCVLVQCTSLLEAILLSYYFTRDYNLSFFTNEIFLQNNVYFDSDLVWLMQLIIIKVKQSCCTCRIFSTLNSY